MLFSLCCSTLLNAVSFVAVPPDCDGGGGDWNSADDPGYPHRAGERGRRDVRDAAVRLQTLPRRPLQDAARRLGAVLELQLRLRVE